MALESLSIVICTKDRKERLLRCIKSIDKQAIRPREVIIVDSSTQNSEKVVKSLISKEIKLTYKHIFCTMTEARNIGIKLSKGSIILFLDDDIILDENYIREILSFYSSCKNPKFGGAEGLITNDSDRRLISRFMNFPKFPGPYDVMKVKILHGCNMSFRKEVLDKFRFDENTIGYYADDDDICCRISKKYNLYFVPTAKLIHEHTSTGGARVNRFKEFNSLVFNKYYIFTKSKSIRNFFSLIFSYFTAFFRIIFFMKVDKHRALKGMFTGFYRILKSIGRDKIQELRNID